MTADANGVAQARGAEAIRRIFDSARPAAPPNTNTRTATISATSYPWRDPETIPTRSWIYGTEYMRGTLTVTLAPGGLGKSSLIIAECLAMVSGRPFLGDRIRAERLKVWYWNIEDSPDELARRIQAAAMYHRIGPQEIEGRLFINAGITMPLRTSLTATPALPDVEVFDAVCRALTERQIDILIIDPFISSHSANENDNVQIDALAKAWVRVAHDSHAAVGLVHHTRKGDAETTTDSGRGAKALTDAARIVRVLNRMTADEAAQQGVVHSRRYFRVIRDKENFARGGEEATWRHMVSVALNNGPEPDEVGVVEAWAPPTLDDHVDSQTILEIQSEAEAEVFGARSNANDWIGHLFAEKLGLDPQQDSARIKAMIKSFLSAGYLRRSRHKDSAKGRMRPVIARGPKNPATPTPV